MNISMVFYSGSRHTKGLKQSRVDYMIGSLSWSNIIQLLRINSVPDALVLLLQRTLGMGQRQRQISERILPAQEPITERGPRHWLDVRQTVTIALTPMIQLRIACLKGRIIWAKVSWS